MTLGAEPLGSFRPPAQVAADAVAAEEAGFGAAWMTHMSRGVDALSVLALAAFRTSRIELGVGVVPTYPRHPHVLAQQAATVQAIAGGRLTLGVGVSHRPVVEQLFGLAYASPAEHLREYLSVLVPLVRTGSVTYRGERYSVEGGFTVPGTSPVDVLVGGMGARTVEVAGRYADGLVTWLAGPAVLDAEIGPGLRAAAADAGRVTPRLVAAAAVAVCEDVDAARAGAGVLFARYQGMANYQRVLARQGDARVADLAVVGDETAVERGVRAYADAGVTELWAVPFPVEASGDDGGLERTRAVLADLARAARSVGGR
jgi:F420-dependent oxidoreductase-like protein